MSNYIVKTAVDRKLERGLGKEELAHWTGSSTRTATVTDRNDASTTVTLLDWVGVDVYAHQGERTGSAISTCQNAIYDYASLFLCPGTWYITSNLTITASEVHVAAGAIINVASGVTLTINGDIKAGRYKIFDNSGTVNLSNHEAHAQWFGAVGDGTGDQSGALNQCLDALPRGGTMILRPNVNSYFRTTGSIDVPDDRTIKGSGFIFSTTAANAVSDTAYTLRYIGSASAIRGKDAHASTSTSRGIFIKDLTMMCDSTGAKALDFSGVRDGGAERCCIILNAGCENSNQYGIYQKWGDVEYGAYFNEFNKIRIIGSEGIDTSDNHGQWGVYWEGRGTGDPLREECDDNTFDHIMITQTHIGMEFHDTKLNYGYKIWIEDVSGKGIIVGSNTQWLTLKSLHLENFGIPGAYTEGIDFQDGALQCNIEVHTLTASEAADPPVLNAGDGCSVDYLNVGRWLGASDARDGWSTKVCNSDGLDNAYRFWKEADGRMEWGDGTNARDVVLYRDSANVLKTDGAFAFASVSGMLNIGSDVALTIAEDVGGLGEVTATKSYHSIIVEGGEDAGDDDLDTINGGTDGDILILRCRYIAAGNVITVQDRSVNGGNIALGAASRVLDENQDRLVLHYEAQDSTWVELSFVESHP